MQTETQLRDAKGEWRPSPLPVPSPVFSGPWKPLVILKGLWGVIWPYNLIYAAMAFVCWLYLTPSLETTASFQIGWIALLYVRNAALLLLVAGALHLRLYIKQGPGDSVSSIPTSGWRPTIANSRFATRPVTTSSGAWSAGASSGRPTKP